ncbi:hypothetical protein BDQ17DRAFT_1421881 [Cyathus striatus]|nr:hypothetical protein BDQ17DRAFT_1421881 [Cyathus striatus]
MQHDIPFILPTFDNEPGLVLVMNPDNPNNASLTKLGDGIEVYRVQSTPNLMKTSIYRPSRVSPFAILERKSSSLSSDILTLQGRVIEAGRWLRFSGDPRMDTPDITFPISFEEGGLTYQWKPDENGDLHLYKKEDFSSAIAWFQSSNDGIAGNQLVTYAAYLVVAPDSIFMRDTIVATFIIIEAWLRMNGKS